MKPQLTIPSWVGNIECREYSNLRELWEIIYGEGSWQRNEPHTFLFEILDKFYILEREKTERGHKRSFKVVALKPLALQLIEVRENLLSLGNTYSNVEFKL